MAPRRPRCSSKTAARLFQLWTINQTTIKDYLLDQKLVGAYLPKADVKITTLDPYTPVTRTRVDQPFTVEIQVSDLLTGTGIPTAASKVLLEQHIQNYAAGQTSLDPTVVAANTPLSTAYITENGKTTLKFPASSLTARRPDQGQRRRTLHRSRPSRRHHHPNPDRLGQGAGLAARLRCHHRHRPRRRIPHADSYRPARPQRPLSAQRHLFVLYEGNQVNGSPGTLIKSYPWDSTTSRTTLLTSDELNSLITKDGTYTVALMSNTVFDTRLLCDPVTFTIKRTMTVNAMQVNFSDDSER